MENLHGVHDGLRPWLFADGHLDPSVLYAEAENLDLLDVAVA
jgi:prepilin-type processing-associated H-X9-DG protein